MLVFCRFVFEDVPLFLGLINDLFPGLDCPRVRYPSFNDAVEAVLQENRYVLLDTQVHLNSSTSDKELIDIINSHVSNSRRLLLRF